MPRETARSNSFQTHRPFRKIFLRVVRNPAEPLWDRLTGQRAKLQFLTRRRPQMPQSSPLNDETATKKPAAAAVSYGNNYGSTIDTASSINGRGSGRRDEKRVGPLLMATAERVGEKAKNAPVKSELCR